MSDLVPVKHFSDEEVRVIKSVIAPDLTDPELQLFLSTCKRTGLDPFSRQIYCTVKVWFNKKSQSDERKISIQATVDGFRVIAERSGKYQGQAGPFWCGADGKWTDVWLQSKDKIKAAKVGVYKADFREPLWAVALVEAYKQDYSPVWQKMPEQMIAKCAESLALRKAFPNDLSGIYTSEEMGQAEKEEDQEPRQVNQPPKQVGPSQSFAPPSNVNAFANATNEQIDEMARQDATNDLDAFLNQAPPLDDYGDPPSAYEELGGHKPKTKIDDDLGADEDAKTQLENYKIGFGNKYRGRTLLDLGVRNVREYVRYFHEHKDPVKGFSRNVEELLEMAKLYEYYMQGKQQ